MSACDPDRLEAFVDGTLTPVERAGTEAHLRECAACAAELVALNAEQALLARRRSAQPPLSPELWRGVEARLARPAPARARRWTGRPITVGVSSLVAAAAALLLFVGQHDVPGPIATPSARVAPSRRARLSPEVTLDRAENEYRDALTVLEAEYRHERQALKPSTAARYDRALANAGEAVRHGRTVAAGDLDGRLALLDGYAEYMRSLQTIVADLQVSQ